MPARACGRCRRRMGCDGMGSGLHDSQCSNSSRDGETGSYSGMPRSGAIGNIEIAQAIRDAGCEPDLIDGLGEAPVLRYPAQLAIADALRQ